MRRTFLPRSVPALLVVAALGGIASLQGGACAQQPITVPVRSLERSGRVAFVCLGDPNPPEDAGAEARKILRPLSDCSIAQTLDIDEYAYEDDAGVAPVGTPIPHLYALVTQTTRGEVAVIDTTSKNRSVLDEDPRIPGANFLPVGAQPVDIVATPGSTATFVGVGEIGHAGLFALPSRLIRPASAYGSGGAGGTSGGVGGAIPVPELSSWPSCALPVAPGRMILVADPPNASGEVRASCDGPYAPAAPAGGLDDLGAEGQGRLKLVVTLPELGQIAVLDAQRLLDQPPGAFAPCAEVALDRVLPLEVDLEDATVPPTPPAGPACFNPPSQPPAYADVYTPRPSGLSYADGRLYVGDQAAPVIHVVDMPTPCDLTERAPLLPLSAEDPGRIVYTGPVSVMKSLTPDLKRYLYAVDVEDASAMIFDVSPSSTSRRPVMREHPEWNPLQPRDRVKFAAPPADLVLVERDIPETDPATGVAAEGVRCDPDPNLVVCTSTSNACDPQTLYRTSSDFLLGASPLKVRGVFAFAALTNGHVAVVDVDDYDAACRGPTFPSSLYGCSEEYTSTTPLASTGELSCNVVMRHAPRDQNYDTVDATAGVHAPQLQAYPQLFSPEGTPLDIGASDAPKMKAIVPASSVPGLLYATVGNALVCVNRQTGLFGEVQVVGDSVSCQPPEGGLSATLAINYEDPRAHVAIQNWTVTFEGAIPGFLGKAAALTADVDPADPSFNPGDPRFDRTDPNFDPQVLARLLSTGRFEDPNSGFCDAGVHSRAAVRESLEAEGLSAAEADAQAARLADYVQILSEVPSEEDPHWAEVQGTKLLLDDGTTVVGECNFTRCLGLFGPAEDPTTWRDLRIVEAFQDHLDVEFRNALVFVPKDETLDDVQKAQQPAGLAELKCCFPDAAEFTVRVGDQWSVVGDVSGFFHHVIPVPNDPSLGDPALVGTCRDSCDPVAAPRRNGRVRRAPPKVVVSDDQASPLKFINPMFRFSVSDGVGPDGVAAVAPPRDTAFAFTTSNPFVPMLITLGSDTSTLTLPQGIIYVPSTRELAVTDGASNGLIMVGLSPPAFSRSFF